MGALTATCQTQEREEKKPFISRLKMVKTKGKKGRKQNGESPLYPYVEESFDSGGRRDLETLLNLA